MNGYEPFFWVDLLRFLQGEQFGQVGSTIQYLHTHQLKALSDLKIEDLITPQELFRQQEDWIWLCSKFTGMEKEFFKPYWIPIQRCGYDYFIDISDEKFPIIETLYDYFDDEEETYHWEKHILFNTIKDLMMVDSEKVDLRQYRVDKTIDKFSKHFSTMLRLKIKFYRIIRKIKGLFTKR